MLVQNYCSMHTEFIVLVCRVAYFMPLCKHTTHAMCTDVHIFLCINGFTGANCNCMYYVDLLA